jgi:hypothetical protein
MRVLGQFMMTSEIDFGCHKLAGLPFRVQQNPRGELSCRAEKCMADWAIVLVVMVVGGGRKRRGQVKVEVGDG